MDEEVVDGARVIQLDYRPAAIIDRDMVLPGVLDKNGNPLVIPGVPHDESPVLPDKNGLTGWRRIHASKAKYRIVIGGRRSGKSFGGCQELVRRAVECPAELIRKHGNSIQCWYVAPTYGQAKIIAWEKLKAFSAPFWHPKKKPNENELTITLFNNMVIAVKGTDKSPAYLEGVPLWFLAFDECAEADSMAWFKHLSPSCSDGPIVAAGGGRVMFLTTPEGDNWVKALYDIARSDKTGQWETFRYAAWQSEYCNYVETQMKITNYYEMGDLDTAMQEYGSSWISFTGRVYKRFSRESHVRGDWEIQPGWKTFVVVDPGGSNPTAGIIGGIDYEGRVWIRHEHYASNMECSAHADALWAKLSLIDPDLEARRKRPDIQIIDSAAKQVTLEFASDRVCGQNVLYFAKANKAVLPGIERVKQVLLPLGGHGNLPGLIIHPDCQVCIKQMLGYRWKPRGGSESVEAKVDPYEAPLKKDDHFPDAIRYLVFSRPQAPRAGQPYMTFEQQLMADDIARCQRKHVARRPGRYAYHPDYGWY